MELQNEKVGCCLDSACVKVRRLAMAAGLNCNDAEECAVAFRKRRLHGGNPADPTCAAAGNGRRLEREVDWFIRRWVYDRTTQCNPAADACSGDEPPVLRNVDLETIAAIVATFTVSARWLWRRVELDGARLKDLAAETGMTPDSLNRDLNQVKRRIRRVLDGG
jgi:DNA-directed RNA polymerase specialized sigma24 family protein